jgi:hypothetical protein
MPVHFDTDAEDAKLNALREEEAEDLARVLSERYEIPYTDLTAIPVNADALRVIPKADAEAAQAIAFDRTGKHISIAFVNIENDALMSFSNSLFQSEALLLALLAMKIFPTHISRRRVRSRYRPTVTRPSLLSLPSLRWDPFSMPRLLKRRMSRFRIFSRPS